MKYFLIIFTLCSMMAYAAVESIFIKGIQFSGNGKEYMVTTYKNTDPWIVLNEVYINESQINFLKGCKPPIWITFKGDEVATIITDGKRMLGKNLKLEEKEKILNFKKSLE